MPFQEDRAIAFKWTQMRKVFKDCLTKGIMDSKQVVQQQDRRVASGDTGIYTLTSGDLETVAEGVVADVVVDGLDLAFFVVVQRPEPGLVGRCAHAGLLAVSFAGFGE